jgi:hypothetical protein
MVRISPRADVVFLVEIHDCGQYGHGLEKRQPIN